jgi:ammonia channel protein AmtB
LIESGAVRRKNRSAALIKNLFNIPITVIAFWLVGYGLGFGEPANFVGKNSSYFASYRFEKI